MGVEELPNLGLSWSKCCSIFTIILANLFGLICLAASLVSRLYLQGYYITAFYSALGFLTSLFVLTHHLTKARSCFGCNVQNYAIVQTVLNVIYLLSCSVMTAAFAVLLRLQINVNTDYIVALVFCVIMILLLLVLTATTASAVQGDRYMEYEMDNEFVWHSDQHGDMCQFGYPAYGDMGTGKSSTFGTLNDRKKLHKKAKNSKPNPCAQNCKTCMKSCCHVINGVIYSFVQLILLIVFVLGACYPVFLVVDTYRYRDSNDLYTVKVEGHKPIAMFLKCRGTGNETIVYENGLGGVGYMVWDFIPKMLEGRYKVCVTDRRGYGWSETFESDHIELLTTTADRQYSKTNSDFLVKLIQEADIQTPFYYIGHSYGGHHLVQVALDHPDILKGIVFLDSAKFAAAVDTLQDYLEVIENFKGLAPVYIATALAPGALTEAFKDTVMLEEMSEDTRQKFLVAIRSAYYTTSYMREYKVLVKDNNAAFRLIAEAIENKTINIPTFVIDAGNYDPQWFPEEHFTKYNATVHYANVPGSTHSLLVASNKYGGVTSELIDSFIRYTAGDLGSSELNKRVLNLTCYIDGEKS